ncbi:MAG: O-methyltransferase [Ignavibacteriae bacterium]|nr:O-methyltransferase [Ignavibacteriota bacterium]NOG99450.1 O-methyltransferase [Ignavibacteriota bacterium]
MPKILHSPQQKYLNQFRTQNDELITQMEKYAEENSIPILDWQSSDFLEQLVLISKPKKVLEIGTAIGYSTIRIARLLNKNSEIDTIEKSKDNIKLALSNIKKSKLADRINLLAGDAFDVMPKLEKKYDMIFLDADKEDYENLFYHSVKLLRKGGIVVIDNLLWHGYAASSKVPPKYKVSTEHIKKFNEIFMGHRKFKSTIMPIGDGLGIGIKIK